MCVGVFNPELGGERQGLKHPMGKGNVRRRGGWDACVLWKWGLGQKPEMHLLDATRGPPDSECGPHGMGSEWDTEAAPGVAV